MALPEHEVAQSLDARRAHQEIQAGQPGREHVVVDNVRRDGFRVRVDSSLRRGCFRRLVQLVDALAQGRSDGIRWRFGMQGRG